MTDDSQGQASADTGESVEVTDEMIETGVWELGCYDPEYDDPRECVKSIVGAVIGRKLVLIHKTR